LAQLLLRGSPLASAAIEAVLFDKDGTLSHSEPMLLALARSRIAHCEQLLSERHPELAPALLPGLVPRLQDTYGMEGDTLLPAGTTAVASREHNLISTATALAQVGLGWPEALELAEAVFQRTDVLQDSAGGPPPQATEGLVELLLKLNRVGVVCAVLSNDERQGIDRFLTSHDLCGCFQALRSAEDHPRKPDPAAVHSLCDELGVDPGRCALIGDANSDLVMAERAGVAVVLGYCAGWRRRPSLAPRFQRLTHWRELGVRST
jgi:phosphoglycolate phosphatase